MSLESLEFQEFSVSLEWRALFGFQELLGFQELRRIAVSLGSREHRAISEIQVLLGVAVSWSELRVFSGFQEFQMLTVSWDS